MSKSLEVKPAGEPARGALIPLIRGSVKDGKLLVNRSRVLAEHLRNLDNKPVEILIRSKQTRTVSQNRYYWGILDIMADELGYDTRFLHNQLKELFLTPAQPDTTSELTPKEFNRYLDSVIRLAIDLEIDLPDPDEVG